MDDGPGKGKPNPNSAVVWEFTKDGTGRADRMWLTTSSVTVADGFVVAADKNGLVHCLDERTGKRHWTHDTKAAGYGHPLLVDGKIYVTGEDGCVWARALGKAKRVIAKAEADSSFYSSPAFANGTLYLLSEKTLYAVRKP